MGPYLHYSFVVVNTSFDLILRSITDSLTPPSGLALQRLDHWSCGIASFLRNTRVTVFVYFGPYLRIFLPVPPRHSGFLSQVLWTVPPYFYAAFTPNLRVTLNSSFGPSSIFTRVCSFCSLLLIIGVTVFRSWDLPPFSYSESSLTLFCFFLPCTYIVAHVIFFVNS